MVDGLNRAFSALPERGRVADGSPRHAANRSSVESSYIIMNSKQSCRLNMCVAVLAVLQSDKYKEMWSSKVALSRAVGELKEVVDRISECAQCQAAKDGAAAEKAQALQELSDTAYEIAAAVKSCASATGNRYLAGQVDFSRSEISKGRDSSVLARCRAIQAAASGVIDSLGDYEVTPARLTALKKKIDAFDAAQSRPRQAKASSSAATKELSRYFKQVTEVLVDRLDGLMVPFKSTEPVFFNEYKAARVVVDSKGSRSSRDANVIASPGATPSSKAA